MSQVSEAAISKTMMRARFQGSNAEVGFDILNYFLKWPLEGYSTRIVQVEQAANYRFNVVIERRSSCD